MAPTGDEKLHAQTVSKKYVIGGIDQLYLSS